MRDIDVSFGITIKRVQPADILPLLEEFRRLAGDGKLRLDKKTERLLERHAATALSLPRRAAIAAGDGGSHPAEGDGRASGALPPGGGDGRSRTVGQLVRALRTRKDLSQEALGRQIGMTRVHISRIELGKYLPNLKTCERLARGLGCDPEKLYLKAAEEWPARRRRKLGLPAQE